MPRKCVSEYLIRYSNILQAHREKRQMVNDLRGLRLKLKKELVGYFTETTVHGFRYIIEGRNRMERAIWGCFIFFGFFYSGMVVHDALQYWETYPVETTIGEVYLPLQELPFPAITLCDTASLEMPRRNRWMFLEQLLNSLELTSPKTEMKKMYPCKYIFKILQLQD